MDPVTISLIGIATTYIIVPFQTLIPVERSVQTIECKNKKYVIEVSNQSGLIRQSLFPHTHKIKLVFPNKKRKDAIFYFTLEDASFFDKYFLLNSIDVHSHTNSDTIYYLAKNKQIYEYTTKKLFNRTPSHLLHNHQIACIDIY
jgi:hypothetical protein